MPVGSRIAFQSSRYGCPEIYVMNADGSGAVRLTGYEVRRRDNNGLEKIVALPAPEYTDDEVSYEGVYAYSVRGVNEFGEGP